MVLSLALKTVSAARIVAGKALGPLVLVLLLCSIQACGGSDSDSDSDSDNDDGKLISYGLIVADINDDGRDDIVTANTSFTGPPNPGTVKVILQDKDTLGKFQDGVFYQMGDDTLDVAVGDVNRDNILDVLSTSRSEETLSYRTQATDRSGTLGEEEELETGLRPGAIVVADINGDLRNDILISGQTLVLWLFYPGDPDDPDDNGAFRFSRSWNISGRTVAVGYLNDDTQLDIVAGSSTTAISVLIQASDSKDNFDPVFLPADLYEVGFQPNDIAIDYLNIGDKFYDIAVVTDSSVAVLLQEIALPASGKFQDAVQYDDGVLKGTQIITALIDGDTNPDIAVTNNLASGGGISILLQSPEIGGGFDLAPYVRATLPWGLGAGYFNDDTLIDLAYSNVDGAWVVLQEQNNLPNGPVRFELPKLVGGNNNSVD